mmetsp:Transcript_136/g.163  ORF Transcript_136/g.163 Transcript_136/m.163 type:complete len:157 (-) Transcript_136:1834-2304(-)
MMQHILLFYVTFAIISTAVFGFQFRNIQRQNRNIFKIHSTSQGSALNKSPLELCDENALIVIEEVKAELGTIFGYDQGSKNVGISGEVELVEVDGPSIRIKLSGRFWHATDTVLMRVESFVKTRIPEVIEVILDEDASDIQDDNRLNSEGGPRKLY